MPLLEYILNVEIRDIQYTDTQKELDSENPLSKSIRMDVYVEDDAGIVYDIEVQTTDEKKNLDKRMRYYQSMLDSQILQKGKRYTELKKSYVIFICSFDPFHHSQYIYTFPNRCDEIPEVVLNDEATKIVISVKGTEGSISDDLKAVLRYMDTGVATTEYTKELDEKVAQTKSDSDVRRQYMLLEEWYSTGMRRAVEQKIVSQIRSSYKKYDADIIADMLNVTKNDLAETVQIISEHPDWDDEKVADAVDWERK